MVADKDLPRFTQRKRDSVMAYVSRVLTTRNIEATHLLKLIGFSDGHYRAIFRPDYFSSTPPSKSQWNTLKKKMKRHDRRVFVFKTHGQTDDQNYYIDFGFFAN